MSTTERFRFGKNWQRFLRGVDIEQRVEIARRGLAERLGSLEGTRFLDVGCGSGLFSLAAWQLGADVHSFDYDADSVSATTWVRNTYATGSERWTVESGDVLDRAYLDTLGRFNTVYAWGVLHHTGDMWTAMDNVGRLVQPGGRLFIALYNDQGAASRRWWHIKRAYVRHPYLRPALLSVSAMRFWTRPFLGQVRRGGVRQFLTPQERDRGMARWSDLVDWVGGFPFEVVRWGDAIAFYADRGFEVEWSFDASPGLGNHQFVFRRQDA